MKSSTTKQTTENGGSDCVFRDLQQVFHHVLLIDLELKKCRRVEVNQEGKDSEVGKIPHQGVLGIR